MCFHQVLQELSSVKTQLIYCQLKWWHVSTQGVIMRAIIEPCMRYIKWKCIFLWSQNVVLGSQKCAKNVLGSQKCAPKCCFGIPKCAKNVVLGSQKCAPKCCLGIPKMCKKCRFGIPKMCKKCRFGIPKMCTKMLFWDPKNVQKMSFWDPKNVHQNVVLGSHKCALSLDVPHTWFNNWPDDDCLSRNMSSLWQ